MAVIGIDLGTTYCAAGIMENGRPRAIPLEGAPTLPSVVSLQKSGKVVVGKTAKRNQANDPQNTIVEIKRKMGENVKVALGQKEFTPQEISAMLLRRIKEAAQDELGEEVTGAVITCPAYFKDPQRSATQEAGKIAGLKVLKIINEPTAAAYAYGVSQDTAAGERLFVVYDLGGGTFDVTVIHMESGVLQVLGTGGDPHLGGGDFDDRIVQWMFEQLQQKSPEYMSTMTDEKKAAMKIKLKSFAEEGKIKLCESQDANPSYTFQIPSVDIYQARPISFNETLTMPKFEELIGDLLINSLKWIDVAMEVPTKEKHFTEQNVTAVLLVGGSTRVPLVRKLLEQRFGADRVRGQECGINPDEIVALGAAIAASDEDPDSVEVSQTTLIDVTGHTLSVAAIDANSGREELCPIIPKETAIPTREYHEFATMGDYQPSCRIRVFQGEGKEINPQKVTMIGEFEISIPRVKESIPLKVELALDRNGILVATATEGKNGGKVKCELVYKDSAQMTPEDLERKRKALDATLNAVHARAASPLSDGEQAKQSTAGAPANAAQSPAGDTTAAMNPIMRSLYNKAINSFDRVPADRQASLFQLVSDIESAARQGDQARLTSFFAPLQKLMEGIV